MISDELERLWTEAVMTQFLRYSILPGESEEDNKKSQSDELVTWK
jgi:hypothetical protein